MVAAARGLIGASLVFIASFALHIVGGASDQGWLFALAVALIYVSAAAFPVIALRLAGAGLSPMGTRAVLGIGFVAGVAGMAGALWAANGRSFAWWTLPAAVALVAVTSCAASRLPGLRGHGAEASRTIRA